MKELPEIVDKIEKLGLSHSPLKSKKSIISKEESKLENSHQ